MLIIPAIDLKDGQCVRLRQGRMDDDTVFSDNPVEMAGRWVDAGARRLHIVDLNGAFEGRPVNEQVIRDIAAAYPDLPIQLGGGIRTVEAAVGAISAGAQRVVLDPVMVAKGGDRLLSDAAVSTLIEQLVPLVYDELRRLARDLPRPARPPGARPGDRARRPAAPFSTARRCGIARHGQFLGRRGCSR